MKAVFFREVRRLGYLRAICDLMAKEKSAEIYLASKKFLNISQELNKKLSDYKRKTGKINKISVAKNHFLVASALGLVKVEGDFVKTTSYAAFFASLPKNINPFNLSLQEKFSFFELLLTEQFNALRHLMGALETRRYVTFNDLRKKLKPIFKFSRIDHLVKSHVEWLIDLDLVIPSAPTKGKFCLTFKGEKIKDHMSVEKERLNEAFINLKKIYAESIIGPVSVRNKINETVLLKCFEKAISATKLYAVSEVSDKLLSAFPVIKFLQLELLLNFKTLIKFEELISIMEDVLKKRGILFNWDPIYKGGYIRYE